MDIVVGVSVETVVTGFGVYIVGVYMCVCTCMCMCACMCVPLCVCMCVFLMSPIHYSFMPLILFLVPYMLSLVP